MSDNPSSRIAQALEGRSRARLDQLRVALRIQTMVDGIATICAW